MRPTQEQVNEAIVKGVWGAPHSKGQKEMIARACLALGVPVTDLLTGTTWYIAINKIIELEERIADLEQGS